MEKQVAPSRPQQAPLRLEAQQALQEEPPGSNNERGEGLGDDVRERGNEHILSRTNDGEIELTCRYSGRNFSSEITQQLKKFTHWLS